ncbi:hypothetical protein RJ640_013090 [Escallonia rubra]|uniref:Uncharacterized protein n=1 Tax=Escallonia rubra TaxID=112253 RepID=A0AA88UNE8_9ASTE|nr:hypothetical protein RJ640_013090 [Escallonia rubra]
MMGDGVVVIGMAVICGQRVGGMSWEHMVVNMTHNDSIRTFEDIAWHLEPEEESLGVAKASEIYAAESLFHKTFGPKQKRFESNNMDIFHKIIFNGFGYLSDGFMAMKRVLRYLSGTLDYVICYEGSDLLLKGFNDTDWGGDLYEPKSTLRRFIPHPITALIFSRELHLLSLIRLEPPAYAASPYRVTNDSLPAYGNASQNHYPPFQGNQNTTARVQNLASDDVNSIHMETLRLMPLRYEFTPGCMVRKSPISEPFPVTQLRRPLGKPANPYKEKGATEENYQIPETFLHQEF